MQIHAGWPRAWFWCLTPPLLAVEALAMAALCQAQVDRAQERGRQERLQDTVFGYCLDQLDPLTISRCRQRFAPPSASPYASPYAPPH